MWNCRRFVDGPDAALGTNSGSRSRARLPQLDPQSGAGGFGGEFALVVRSRRSDPDPPHKCGAGVGSAGAEEMDQVVGKNYRDIETETDKETPTENPEIKGQEIDQETERDKEQKFKRSQEAARPKKRRSRTK